MELTDVRRHNLSVVLGRLLHDGPQSRAALARQTGFTKGTVSLLIGDLLDRELVEERDKPAAGRVGRRATNVAATGAGIGGLGLEIAVDRVAASIVDLTGQVRTRREHRADNRSVRSGRVIQRLRTVAGESLADADRMGIRCVAGTLALPGLVDPAAEMLRVAPNLHWFDADLLSVVSGIQLPPSLAVAVDNEANLAALAEMRLGAGRGLTSFVYVSGGVGIGAGIVLGGQLVRGAHGFAGELGHVVVDPQGRRCACGALGCLETFVGAGPDPASDDTARALAAALRSVVHLLDPQAVLLGGTFTALGEDFAATVEEQLAAITLGARWARCAVRPAALGADATLIGAATVSLDGVLADPLTIVPARPSRPA